MLIFGFCWPKLVHHSWTAVPNWIKKDRQTRQACLNPQKRYSFFQSDAGILRYENQEIFKKNHDFLVGGKVTQSCWGNEKMCWGSDTSCWGSDSSCWGNEAILLGKRSKLLGKWSNFVGEVTQKSLGRCPKYKVKYAHVIQCSLKDSLLQRSGQIHGPLEYSVQSWHVHLVGKSVQDWPRKNWR